jgi:hypothetical protein
MSILRVFFAAIVGILALARLSGGQVPERDERSLLVSSDSQVLIGQLSTSYMSIQDDLFVTAECASEIVQDCMKLVASSIEERRFLVLKRALRELRVALISQPSKLKDLVELVTVALALLGDVSQDCASSTRKAQVILAKGKTWEQTPHLGFVLVDWDLNSPQGIYASTESLRRLWLATRFLQLYPVVREAPLWISTLKMAFEGPELRDLSNELCELHKSHVELWGDAEKAILWETHGEGVWSPRAADEDLCISEFLESGDGVIPDASLWNLILRIAIDKRVLVEEPRCIRNRVMDLLALWPRAIQPMALFVGVEEEFWCDLDWHARGTLYLAMRETDMLVTSGPVTGKAKGEVHVIVEPRPLVFSEFLEILLALESIVGHAEARGVRDASRARERLKDASSFIQLCLEWTLDAMGGKRNADREEIIAKRIRGGILTPYLCHQPSRLVIAGAGWMQRERLESVVVAAADGRKYTGVRTLVGSGK